MRLSAPFLSSPAPGSFLARLQLDGSKALALKPQINLSCFSRSGQRDLGSQVATSGAYTDGLSGAAIGPLRLEQGEYLLVASTFAPGVEAGFVLQVYAEAKFELMTL